MEKDYFGGLNWSLFFREKPAFSKGEEVLVCRIEDNGREKDSFLKIDDIPFRYSPRFENLEETISYDSILSYFNNDSIRPLLNSWILSELTKERLRGGRYYSDIGEFCPDPELDSFFTIKNYLLDDYKSGNNKDYHNAIKSVCEQFLQGYRANGKDKKAPQEEENPKKEKSVPLSERMNPDLYKTLRHFVDIHYLIELDDFFALNVMELNPETGRPYCKNLTDFGHIFRQEFEKKKCGSITCSDIQEYIFKYEKKSGKYKQYTLQTIERTTYTEMTY